jgi:PKD repeat protein
MASIISVDITDVAGNNTMSAGSLAGAPGVRTNNWNTIKAASGTNSFTSGLKYSDGIAVAAPFKITYAGYQSSIAALGLTNDKLMFGAFAQDRESAGYYPMHVTLTNIPFAKYDIYIYADTSYQNGGGKISMVGQQDYWVKTAGQQIINATGSTYIQITNTTQASASNQVITTTTGTGNYVKYSNLTGTVQDFTVDALSVYGLPTQRLNLAGFQIVQIAETAPVAGFSASPTSGVSPLAVTFTDTSTGSITNRFWNFGDGATTNTTATSLNHTYASTGTYSVALIVSGALGSSTNTQNNVITVFVPDPPPAGLSVSQMEVIYTKEQRAQNGRTYWPDGNMGVMGDGNGGYVFYAANGPTPIRTTGSLNDIAQQTTNVVIAGGSNYNYKAGGPVYLDPASGRYLLFYHAEIHPGGNYKQFYSVIGLAVSDAGSSTKFFDCGKIIQPNITPEQAEAMSTAVEVGGGSYIVRDGFFQVYFRDTLTNGSLVNLTVARASVTDVVQAALNHQSVAWAKYYGSSFSEPGIGGLSSALESDNPGVGWMHVAWNYCIQKYVMVVSRGGDLYLVWSDDSLNWSSRTQIESDPGESFYPTMIGAGSDPQQIGGKFYLYYTYSIAGGFNRYSDAQLVRRTITVEPQDTDVDGIADWWELRYFGSLTNANNTTDADHDGFLDFCEYGAGTDPTNGSSCLLFSEVRATGSNIELRWESASNRIYQIMMTTNLFRPFTPLATNLWTTSPLNVYTDAFQGRPTTFYRLSVAEQ